MSGTDLIADALDKRHSAVIAKGEAFKPIGMIEADARLSRH